MRALAVVGMLALASSAQAKEQPAGPCVPVFVTTAGSKAGFTDPNKDNIHTRDDLADSLKGKKAVCLVDAQDKATIVLEVLGRGKEGVTAGMFGAGRDCIVRVKFRFRDFETEMVGSAMGGTMASGGAWSKAAGKVGKQVEQWVIENRAKIDEPAPAPAPNPEPTPAQPSS
jgi:hypothetical protein